MNSNLDYLETTPQKTIRGLNTIKWATASNYAKRMQAKRFDVSPIGLMTDPSFTFIEFEKRLEKAR